MVSTGKWLISKQSANSRYGPAGDGNYSTSSKQGLPMPHAQDARSTSSISVTMRTGRGWDQAPMWTGLV